MRRIGVVMQPPKGQKPRPVRRDSHRRGRCEGAFWRPTSRLEVSRIVLAARRYERLERQPGRRNGPLGHVAIEVLDLLANLVSFRTGRLEPSIETMMGRLSRSRGAVVNALKALREHGFLDRLRRYEETGQDAGPQVRQVSNAYRLSLPARAARLLGRWRSAAPLLPDDVVQMEADRFANLAKLPPADLPLFTVSDGPLASALAALGRRVRDRESTGRPEIPTKVLPLAP